MKITYGPKHLVYPHYSNSVDEFIPVKQSMNVGNALWIAIFKTLLMRFVYLLHTLKWMLYDGLYYYFFGEKITVEFPILGLMPMVLFMMMAGKNFLDILVTIPRDLDHYALSAHYYKAQSLKRKTASKEKNQKARV